MSGFWPELPFSTLAARFLVLLLGAALQGSLIPTRSSRSLPAITRRKPRAEPGAVHPISRLTSASSAAG